MKKNYDTPNLNIHGDVTSITQLQPFGGGGGYPGGGGGYPGGDPSCGS